VDSSDVASKGIALRGIIAMWKACLKTPPTVSSEPSTTCQQMSSRGAVKAVGEKNLASKYLTSKTTAT
jgi:hypothetical protein